MKTRRAVRRRERDRKAFTRAWFGVAAILLLAGTFWLTVPGQRKQGGIGGPFTLMADDGYLRTERSFPGKYLAVYFGYTHCQDVCPATLNTLAAALARLGGAAERVQPLFITVDPSRDSPAVLRRFVAGFAPNLMGLTGTPDQLAKVERGYRVVSVPHVGAAPASYVVDHSSVIYLIDPDGAFVAPIPADASEMVMAQAIARYVRTPS